MKNDKYIVLLHLNGQEYYIRYSDVTNSFEKHVSNERNAYPFTWEEAKLARRRYMSNYPNDPEPIVQVYY